MSRKSIATPLTVIIVGVIFTIAALSAPERRAGVGARDQNVALQVTHSPADCASYPKPDFDYIPEDCQNLTTTPQTTTTTTPTGTVLAGSGTPTTTATATTTVGTIAPPPTVAVPTRSVAPLPPTVASPDETAPADVTPTPSNTLLCAPGERVLITGQGPPRAAFLLYFGQRVVSGGSVSLSGSFAIPLVVGRERPGNYPVTVRVRGSEQVLRELTCEVPPAAPPTPIRSQPI